MWDEVLACLIDRALRMSSHGAGYLSIARSELHLNCGENQFGATETRAGCLRIMPSLPRDGIEILGRMGPLAAMRLRPGASEIS